MSCSTTMVKEPISHAGHRGRDVSNQSCARAAHGPIVQANARHATRSPEDIAQDKMSLLVVVNSAARGPLAVNHDCGHRH